MRVLAVGLGIQGRKRLAVAGPKVEPASHMLDLRLFFVGRPAVQLRQFGDQGQVIVRQPTRTLR